MTKAHKVLQATLDQQVQLALWEQLVQQAVLDRQA
jgi:hypothetical protein